MHKHADVISQAPRVVASFVIGPSGPIRLESVYGHGRPQDCKNAYNRAVSSRIGPQRSISAQPPFLIQGIRGPKLWNSLYFVAWHRPLHHQPCVREPAPARTDVLVLPAPNPLPDKSPKHSVRYGRWLDDRLQNKVYSPSL